MLTSPARPLSADRCRRELERIARRRDAARYITSDVPLGMLNWLETHGYDRDDLAQLAWASALAALEERGEAPAHPKKWLRGHAHNHALNLWRKSNRLGRAETTELGEELEAIAYLDPHDETTARETLAIVADLQREAPREARQAWALHQEGRTFKAIASMMGVAEGTAHRRVRMVEAKIATLFAGWANGAGCEARGEAVTAFVAGTATDAERDQAQAHLAWCSACRSASSAVYAHRRALVLFPMPAAAASAGLLAKLSIGRRGSAGPLRSTSSVMGKAAAGKVATGLAVAAAVAGVAVVKSERPTEKERAGASHMQAQSPAARTIAATAPQRSAPRARANSRRARRPAARRRRSVPRRRRASSTPRSGRRTAAAPASSAAAAPAPAPAPTPAPTPTPSTAQRQAPPQAQPQQPRTSSSDDEDFF